MKKLLILLLYLSNTLNINAQGYHKVILTDVKFLSRQTPNDSKESFPNYFVDQLFTENILSNIGSMVRERYNAQRVEYALPGVIEYKFGSFADGTRLNKFASAPAIGNIFVSIESIVQFSSSVNGKTFYKLITEVNSIDGKGKKVYHFINKIPFSIKTNDSITGLEKISKGDLFNLYLDGVQNALIGKHKKLEPRIYIKPTSTYYKEFLANSEKLYMIPGNNIYNYGKTIETSNKIVLEFKYNMWRSIGGNISGNILDNSNRIKDEYKLSNLFTKEDYLVKLSGGSSNLFNILTIGSEFKIEFNKGYVKVGSFIVTDWNRIEGNFNGNNFIVNQNPIYAVQEIYKSGTLIALVNSTENKKTIFLKKDTSEQELGELFNLIFAWDFTMMLKQKAKTDHRVQ